MATLFNPFCRMLDTIPVQGIPHVLELQKRMLEDDLAQKRTVPINDVRSILNFCEFVEATRQNVTVQSATLPFPHVVFYRKIVARMVEANILPAHAAAQFDATFASPFQRPTGFQYSHSLVHNY
jgi:hypothetical protein